MLYIPNSSTTLETTFLLPSVDYCSMYYVNYFSYYFYSSFCKFHLCSFPFPLEEGNFCILAIKPLIPLILHNFIPSNFKTPSKANFAYVLMIYVNGYIPLDDHNICSSYIYSKNFEYHDKNKNDELFIWEPQDDPLHLD